MDKFKTFYDKDPKIEKFWDFVELFPFLNRNYIVSLGEGMSPCKRSKKFHEILEITNLYFKDEIHNPTNSFKDRTAALLISHSRNLGYDKVVCASNGNQGASIAAYSSLEGMKCVNFVPKNIDIGKKAQMIANNSEIITEGETVDDSIQKVLSKDYIEFYQCTPELNPLTIEAQKTISLEIFQQIGQIDSIITPMGSGGLMVSLWKGFKELFEIGLIKKIPRIIGVQSQISSPIVNEINKKIVHNQTNYTTKSHALGILVKNPFYKELCKEIIKNTNGFAVAISEGVMLTFAEELARIEGIFAEPASALTIAALSQLREENKFETNEKIVCIITGSAIKTPYVLEALSNRAKTAGMGSLLSSKLKILSQISISKKKGLYGTKLKEMIGSISLAAIYQHLKELEEKNLIVRRKEGKTVLYTITDKGKKVLEALETLITLF
ncbi:MAG: pyridoxal-phosphate dependent enzyme [Candidatus Lokiarchaeota archaeon]|nr:pyridoxal-phosphate dependent enzyme [Candidatus Lokiarchaeota archaeon]MBD3199530.1 pyridoxal-phosphate dependent enzyme [Candidatus Lokiarchaeota archaeon]